MSLPIPNSREVEAFKTLYSKEFGVDLSPQEALEVATCTLQIFYLKHYPRDPRTLRASHAIHPLRPQIQ